jgi:hypothetical protein
LSMVECMNLSHDEVPRTTSSSGKLAAVDCGLLQASVYIFPLIFISKFFLKAIAAVVFSIDLIHKSSYYKICEHVCSSSPPSDALRRRDGESSRYRAGQSPRSRHRVSSSGFERTVQERSRTVPSN